MKRKNMARNALVTSIISLMLCVSMLVGTTFAWFTDSVVSGTNVIAAGNLDVELLANGQNVTSATKLFDDVTLWEPGAVAYENFVVENVGNLALKYQMSINFDNMNYVEYADGVQYTLADVLKVAVVEGGFSGNREAAYELTGTSLSSFILSGVLEGQTTSNTYGVVIFWAPGENEYDNLFNMNNGKTTSNDEPLSIDLGINLFATQEMYESDSFGPTYDGATSWVTLADTNWYFNDPEASTFTINSAEELAGMAALVNGTAVNPFATTSENEEEVTEATTVIESFAGKTVVLGNNIDLAGHEWTPIGNWDNAFEGTFDGNGKTISNLYINDAKGEGVGFFGVVANATIKNLTIKNVNVNAYSMVAGVVGAAYPATISNCHVIGNVNIVAEYAYVAGVAGYCYYGTQVDGCSVVAAGTSLIKSETRNAVGGITAWLLEGDHKVTNCAVENLNLVGWTNVGGITGFVHYNNTIEGCSVKNVTLTKTRVDGNPGIGLIAGGWSYHATNAITLKNNEVNIATLNGTHKSYEAYNELYGSEYGGATTSNFVLENNTTSGVKNNLVEIVAIKDATDLKKALTNGGDNYVLTEDITIDKNETITIANGVSATIDLNSHKISGTADKSGNQELFLVKGNLTMNNGKINYTAANNQEWNAMATIFDVTAGGVLNLDSVKASVSGTDMNFIVHLNNWGSASATITNCDFDLSYVAVRAFNSGNDMNNVTIKNTDVTGGARLFWVHNYTTEGKGDSTLNLNIYGNNNTSKNEKPVRFGFENALYFDLNGTQLVTATTLDEVMAAAKNGNVIIDAQGANLGDFNYAGTFGNGTVLKNAKFTYVYGASVDGVATFENCEFVSDHSYSANFSDGSYTGKVIFNNCYFDGWNSFGTAITYVEMNNCTFETVVGPYSLLRFYQDAELNKCVIKDSFDGIDTNKTGTVVKLNNCTGIEGKIYNNTNNGVVQVGKWIVDGVELTDVPAW